jgi:cell division protein FtsL
MSELRNTAAAVFGSLAYDLSHPELFREPEEESAPNIAAPPRTRTRERAVPAVRPRYAVAPAAVIGLGIAAVILVFSLMGRMQLAQVSDETVELSNRLEEMEEEHTKLLIEHESTFNFTEIEKYAIEELGMQKARNDQIYYVQSAAAPDKAVVLETEKNSFSDRLFALADSIGACFR